MHNIPDFIAKHHLHPIIGAEIEWYLRPCSAEPSTAWINADSGLISKYFAALQKKCSDNNIDILSLDEEDGHGQVEVSLPPTDDIPKIISQLNNLKKYANLIAGEQNLLADFSAKPYAGQYGNGLHIHIHLNDENGNNMMWKNGDDMSDELKYSLAGLLATTPEYMNIFAPSNDSWQRFKPKFNAPVNASWGTNNRTTALRLPDSTNQYQGVDDIAANPTSHERRIEHRIAGADANIAQVIAAIIAGIDYGLSNKPPLPDPIYGDASDEQYGLESFENISFASIT